MRYIESEGLDDLVTQAALKYRLQQNNLFISAFDKAKGKGFMARLTISFDSKDTGTAAVFEVQRYLSVHAANAINLRTAIESEHQWQLNKLDAEEPALKGAYTASAWAKVVVAMKDVKARLVGRGLHSSTSQLNLSRL